MNPPDEFYLALTDIVLNREQTGYRGVYRTPPTSLAFAAEKQDAINALVAAEADEDWLPTARDATAYAQVARDFGYECEIVRCVVGRAPQVALRLQPGEAFLGWDVAEVGGGYSVIVDRCMQLWEEQADPWESKYPTLRCVAEYFNARLNENRLFDTYEQAALYLRVDRECAERFDGEMNVTDLCPIAVMLCGEE